MLHEDTCAGLTLSVQTLQERNTTRDCSSSAWAIVNVGWGGKSHYTAHATMPMQLSGCPCAVDIFLALRMQVQPAISCLQLKACKLIKTVGLVAFASELICCCQPGGLCFLMKDRTYSMAPPPSLHNNVSPNSSTTCTWMPTSSAAGKLK